MILCEQNNLGTVIIHFLRFDFDSISIFCIYTHCTLKRAELGVSADSLALAAVASTTLTFFRLVVFAWRCKLDARLSRLGLRRWLWLVHSSTSILAQRLLQHLVFVGHRLAQVQLVDLCLQ